MRAVIYCRVSTTEQVANLSLPTQEKFCREYCAREGFDVARVFIERGESAKTVQRPEFLNLLGYCRQNKGKVHALVVYSLTRFSRNTADHHTIRGLLAGLGINLRSVSERIDETPIGRLLETVLSGVAQFDNDVRAERTIVGMKEAVSRGRWVWTAPLGYTNSRDKAAPSLRQDPIRAPLIHQAFDLFANGRDQRSVLRVVSASGLTTRTGKPLTAQSLNNLLRNPAYVGRVRSPRWNTEHEGDFDPIVSESLYARVQARLSGVSAQLSGRHQDDPDFPLRRFVRCDSCGTPLTGSRSRGRSGIYPYYHCRRGCHGIAARKGVLETKFVGLLDSLRPRPEYINLFRAIVLDVWKAECRLASELVAQLRTRVSTLQSDLQRINDAFVLERSIDRATYNEMRDRIREQIAVAELKSNEAQLQHTDVEGVLAFAEHVMSNASALWVNARAEGKRALQAAFFPEGLRWNGEGFGTALTCAAFSYLREISVAPEEMASPPRLNMVSGRLRRAA